jgi:hypothetical protein
MASVGGAPSTSAASRSLRLAAWLLLGLALMHAVLVVSVAPVVPEDDAYITLTYAANLAAGHGLVYKPGQRILATTSPLYAVLLGGIARVAGVHALPAASVRLNLLWLPATALLLVLLLLRVGVRAPLPELSAAWFLTIPETLTVALGGMEPWLFAALVLAAFLAAAQQRWATAGVLSAAATLARPEGVWVVALVAVCCWLSDRRRIAALAVGAGAPLAAWTAWALTAYGTPVTQSVAAKLSSAAGWWPMFQGLAERISRWLLGSGSTGWVAVIGLVLSIVLAVCAVVKPRPGVPALARLMPLLFFLVGLELVLGNPGWYPWYGGIVLIPWLLALVLGLDATVAMAGRLTDKLRLGVSGLVGGLALIGLVGSALAVRLPHWPGSAYGAYTPYRLRILSYGRAAAWLNSNAAPSSSVMAAEIGMVGFEYRQGPVLDAAGLVTKEALDCRPPFGPDNPTGGAIAPELVRRTQPDFVVTLPMFGLLLQKDQGFLTEYRLAAAFDVPQGRYPAYRVLIYSRAPSDTSGSKRELL